MGWSLAQDCHFILRLTIYTLACEHFTYFPTCTPNSSPVSPILLLSLAFMFFPHRWVERAPGGLMVKKHMKEVKAVDKQDLEMTDHEPMPPAFCICCKARWEQMKFWSGNKSLLEWKPIAPMQIWQSTIFHPDGQIAFVCQNWPTSWKGLINISWHVFIF